MSDDAEEMNKDSSDSNDEKNSDTAQEDDRRYREALWRKLIAEDAMNQPPPAYTLTSPCLPPADTKHQPWPPEPPPPFDRLPPYPAGPKLAKTEYPKNIPGPTYACPYCDGRFLYHRQFGLVECPFCYESISIGHYIRYRALMHICFGLFTILISITSIATLNANSRSDDYSPSTYICGVACLFGLSFVIRAVYLQAKYQESERIEF